MAAIMEPAGPEIDEPRAEALEPVAETVAVVEDPIPLESMTWPELKRVAREFDLKLNVKKSVLIRQIREARCAVIEDEAHRETFRGRMESFAAESRERIQTLCESLAAWWKSDAADAAGKGVSQAMPAPGMSRFSEIAIWVGGILAGGAVAVLAALI